MITLANYLDFENLIINELIGNVWLAYFIGLLIIVAASHEQGNAKATGIVCVAYTLIFSLAIIKLIPLIVLGIFFVGFLFYAVTKKSSE